MRVGTKRACTLALAAMLATRCDRRPAEDRLADRLCECAKTRRTAMDEVKKALAREPFSETVFIEKYEASVAANDSCVKIVESDSEFVAVAHDPKRLEAYRTRAGKLCVDKIRTESEELFKKFKAKQLEKRNNPQNPSQKRRP
jgi:hypothetical protein